ncbi:scavenger receptor cysteine-rich type 1 protein M160-like isoform X2 [Mya arenaria]|uniref:scavenger receptor cysteine-rich type 1 protein M160-like isoform X2 n=1 Tax=Mya arenaria TaxID=6604 RepID=UPI0022E4E886|nr:scavenger receptor cysteine-rich type 1 protein M160-like isoform X2 [Mya arenaria]
MDLRKQILVLVLICTSALAENLRLDNITGYDYEGPVQVNVNGEWAYVSKHSIEPTTAKTICKLLGHGYVGFPVDKFIYMTGNLTSGLPMLVGILSCNGTENDISTCIKGSNNVIPRGASYVAGVHCFEHAFSEVRLMGGATPRNGLVQVRMDDRWGYMCGYNWVPSTIEDVICRTIGYTHSNGTSLPLSIDHSKNHINWLEAAGMVCDISESKLNQCAYVHRLEYQFACKEYYQTVTCHTRLGEVCTTDEHCSGVANAVCVNNLCSCKTGYLTLGEQCPGDFLRLRNVTEYKYEGVVLLNANGTWGHVNMHESAVGVVCRNLGYGDNGIFVDNFYYNDHMHPQVASAIRCFGNETEITQCDINWIQPFHGGYDLTGVHCFEQVFTEMRLVGGESNSSGALQVKMDNRWGDVCILVFFSFTYLDVICRSFGFIAADLEASRVTPLPNDFERLTVWLDLNGDECFGNETHFNQCSWSGAIYDHIGCRRGQVKVTCKTSVELFERCTNNEHCTSITHAYCRGTSCRCSTGYQGENGTCTGCPFGTHGLDCANNCTCDETNTVVCDAVTGQCICKNGWIGVNCNIDIDECDSVACPNNSVCNNQPGGFKCSCTDGFLAIFRENNERPLECKACTGNTFGPNCSSTCDCNEYHVIDQAQMCNHITGICQCVTGWQGLQCTDDINECSATRCSGAKEKCVNLPGTYKCECQDGDIYYHDGSCLKECQQDKHGEICNLTCNCSGEHTRNEGKRTCDIKTGSCFCEPGWAGYKCTEDFNECFNESICTSANTDCRNTDGDYACDCIEGYVRDGETCISIAATGTYGESNIVWIAIGSAGGIVGIAVFVFVVWLCVKRKTNGKESNGRHEIPSTIRNSVQLRSSVPKSEDYFTINDNGRDRGYTDLQSKRDENRNNRLNSAKPLNESGHYDYISDKKPDHPQSLTMRKDEKGYIEFQYRPGAEYLPLEKEAKVNNDYLKVHGSNKGSNVDHPYLTPKYGQHDEGYLRPISNNRHQNTRKRDDEQDGYLRPVSNRRRNTTNLQEKPVEDGYLKANRRQER